MNHTMDIFWTCFDSLGGTQWCIGCVKVIVDVIPNMCKAGGK